MQNRKHYANGKTIESATGYTVRVGEPLVDMTAKAASTSLSMPSDPIQDGSYLISLEVNGTVVAAREAYDFASGSCTAGDYTIAYSSGAVTVSTTSNNDVVVLKIEPLEVFTTDEFRAAVKNACNCDSSGGGSPLIVRCTVSNDLVYVLSEDWDTINEAFTLEGRPVLIELTDPGTKSAVERRTYCLVTEVQSAENFVSEQRSVENASETKSDIGTGYVVVCTNLSNVDFNFKYLFHSDTSSGTLSCSEAVTIGGGSGGGMLKVTASVSGEDLVLDKNYNEIVAAMADGGAYIYFEAGNEAIISGLVGSAFVNDGGNYVIQVPVAFPNGSFVSASATGLLVYGSNSPNEPSA